MRVWPRQETPSLLDNKYILGVLESLSIHMAGKNDPASVLVQLRPKLVEAFKFNHIDLADLMYCKDFLSNHDYEAVKATFTKSEKAGIMMDSLISKVKINPKYYQTFLLLVRSEGKFSDVVDLLDSGKSTSFSSVERGDSEGRLFTECV